MIKIPKILFVLLMALFLSGCQDDTAKDKSYNFVGDSIITRWPLAETLPSQLVYNFGRSGAGLTYIQQLRGRFAGEDIVVLIGTNDNRYFRNENLDEYVNEYLDAVSELTDRNIYLFSVLPRDFKGDCEGMNGYIANFNDRIKASLSPYSNIVYIDVFDDFMDEDHINYQYYSDGLHLNIYGYEILSSRFLQAIN